MAFPQQKAGVAERKYAQTAALKTTTTAVVVTLLVPVVALVPVVVVVIVLGAVLDSIRQLHEVDVQNAGRTPTNR